MSFYGGGGGGTNTGWKLVESFDVTSTTFDETVSVDGDASPIMMINGFGTFSSGNNPYILFNNDSGLNYYTGSILQDGASLTGYVNTVNKIALFPGPTATGATTNFLYLKDIGAQRQVQQYRSLYDTINVDKFVIVQWFRWTNTTDKITSIQLKSAGDFTGFINFYKMVS